MSRNLCTDTCETCGHLFTLGSFRDQPIEFRKYGPYPPVMGAKLVCPCGKVYFGWIRTDHKYWAEPRDALKDTLEYRGVHHPNTQKGKFISQLSFDGRHHVEDVGYYQIDLSYYESYNARATGSTPRPRLTSSPARTTSTTAGSST